MACSSYFLWDLLGKYNLGSGINRRGEPGNLRAEAMRGKEGRQDSGCGDWWIGRQQRGAEGGEGQNRGCP